MATLRRFCVSILAVCVCQAHAAGSYTVYRSVAEDGSVSFSDRRPAADAEFDVVQLQVPVSAEPKLLRQRLRSMRETTDRMAADRRARERHRAELRALSARERALQQAAAAVPAEPPGYYVVRPAWRRHHPRFRPHPAHLPAKPYPIHQPAAAPLPTPAGLGRVKAYNSQLMRSMLSYTR
jgi:hypothetical protein